MVGALCLCVSLAASPATEKEAALALEDLEQRFRAQIYPFLSRGGADGCVGCHDAATSSDLVFIGDGADDFKMLLGGGYFERESPDGLLSRLLARNPKRRMPKGPNAHPWSEAEINLLSGLVAELRPYSSVLRDDECFPLALLEPYREDVEPRPDTQFLTYTQLRGKIKALFGDDWRRQGRDRFRENIALFGGADFETRFNESSQATSGYMSALRLMASDVASLAYLQKRGPFHGPVVQDLIRRDRSQAVGLLYRALLNREPSSSERTEAEALYSNVMAQRSSLEERPYDLGFELTVRDPKTGLSARRLVSIPIHGGGGAIHQEWVRLPVGESQQGPMKQGLEASIALTPQRAHRLVLSPLAQGRSVSFAGLLLEHVDGALVEWIGVNDSRVELKGAWKLSERHGYWSAEESSGGAQNSQVVVPLQPDFEGDYRLALYFRPGGAANHRALVEVWHAGDESVVVDQGSGPVEKAGLVRYQFDGTVDTEAYVDFEGRFRFGEQGYVEVNNTDTTSKVAVGPVVFRDLKDGEVEVDTKEARGFADWAPFKAISFNAYNRRGTRVEDRNERKGELSLRYFPGVAQDRGWAPDRFYQVRLYYPGKRDHESRTPFWVRAEASSPLLRVRSPVRAVRGSRVRLDASESFTVQGSPLEFSWRQVEGLPVLVEPDGAGMEFDVPAFDGDYYYWTSLAQALIRHPDFLFTRPPALDWVSDPIQRWDLSMSRLALDLVGRAPSASEWRRFRQERNWSDLVHYYLASEDFKTFYRHRIRLYLESQGTEEQDEPVRLWCYVAFNDRPFQEILTARYTVNEAMEAVPRPAYHGRSGLLTSPGFIAGKPGLPHYNYAAQVSMLFLGYRYEVPAEIVEQREGVTALGTTDPNSACYRCHKILTPLAFQRSFWTDEGKYRLHDEYGLPIEASDHGLVEEYPFKGEGLEAFALQAVKKERFIRTMIDTHFDFMFGRAMRYRTDERVLYKSLWDEVHDNGFSIKGLIRALAMSPQYRQTLGLNATVSTEGAGGEGEKN